MIDKKDKYTVDKTKAYEHQQAARTFIKKKKYHEAIKELSEAARYDPFCPNHFCNLGYYCMEIGQEKEAAVYSRMCFELIDEVINTTGLKHKTQVEIKDYAEMLSGAGTIMEYYGDPDAKRCLETAATLDPKNWSARYNLGLYYLKTDLTEDAISEFTAAYNLNKHYPDLITELAYSFSSVGMIDESFRVIDTYKKDHPLTADMQYILADNYYGLGHGNDALVILKEIADKEPKSAFVHAALAEVYAHTGMKNEAYNEINIAKRLNKEKKDQEVENIIKNVLKWLDDPDDDNNTMVPVFLLMLMKNKMSDKKNLSRY